MIFSIVIILLLGVIAYFYYAQGFLTSLLTAASAAMAAVVAVSYHENLAMAAFKNRLTDEGTAFSLILLYAITFVVLRLSLDGLVPGNIRLPVLLDRIGSGLFGLIAGLFATGIFAIAAQTLPFGPSIMGLSRFKTLPARDVHVPTGGQATDSQVSDELSSEKFTDDDRQSLLLPVDDWVLGLVSYLSDGGSLEGSRTLVSVHPNYLDEAFAQRLGIQPGAEHMTVNWPGHQQVSVPLAYCPPELAEADEEIPQLRNGTLKLIKPSIKPDGANVLLVVRALFTVGAADSDDKVVRFSTGTIRLVANGVNYYPLGTIDDAGVLRMDKPDDPLFVGVGDADHAADLVFYVPRANILQGGTITKSASGKTVSESFGSFAPGVFLEVKRMAQNDLSDVKIVAPQAPDKTQNVLRKKGLVAASATVAIAAPADMGNDAPFEFDHMDVSPTLFTPIAIGTYDGDNTAVTFPSGTALVRGKHFAKLTVTAAPMTTIGNGDNAIDQLFVPPGMKAVQLVGTLPPKANDPWTWAEHLSDFSVTDSTDKPFKPAGVIAKVMKSIQPMVVGAYDADAGVASIPTTPEVRPTDVYLIFLVPDGSTLKNLEYQGKSLAPLNKSVTQ